MTTDRTAPASERATEHLQGHWVLAKAGKRVLRPGGKALTGRLLDAANPRGRGELVEGDAAHTGLPDASADLVVGEAVLTMQGEAGKRAIIAEARRVLVPGGRYAVHELGLKPDDVAESVKEDVRRSLAQAIKVNARPLTMAEWRELFESEGFDVEWYTTGDMALLQPKRLLEDEGPAGVARMARTMLRDPALRRRILTMRSTFARNKRHLCAVALVATRRD